MLGMKHGSQAIPEQMSVLRRGQRARGTAHIIVVFSHVTMLASFKILFLFNSSWVDNHSGFFHVGAQIDNRTRLLSVKKSAIIYATLLLALSLSSDRNRCQQP